MLGISQRAALETVSKRHTPEEYLFFSSHTRNGIGMINVIYGLSMAQASFFGTLRLILTPLLP